MKPSDRANWVAPERPEWDTFGAIFEAGEPGGREPVKLARHTMWPALGLFNRDLAPRPFGATLPVRPTTALAEWIDRHMPVASGDVCCSLFFHEEGVATLFVTTADAAGVRRLAVIDTDSIPPLDGVPLAG